MNFEERIERLLAKLEALGDIPTKHDLKKMERNIMTAIDSLTAAVAGLTTAVDAAVSDINALTPTDTAIQAAADTVNAQSARLNAATNTTPAPVTPAA